MTGQPRFRGFTLIELLIVIAIIGLLVALLAPAANAVRMNMNRMGCAINLKQIGTGIELYYQTWDRFPPGGWGWRPFSVPKGTPPDTYRQLAWSALILDYLDAKGVSSLLNIDKAFDSAANTTAAAMVVSLYICPAVPTKPFNPSGRAPSHYGGMYGERITSPNNPPKGLMIYDTTFQKREVTDGIAQTIIVSEDSTNSGGEWINGLNVFDQAYAINQAPAIENDMRSEHKGGVNSLFADGSVKFLNQYMDLKIVAAICTREGGELIDRNAIE